jgi:hypothetical protein
LYGGTPNFTKPATNCRRDNKPQKEGKDEQQATSDKQQAPSDKRQETEQEAIKIHEAWCIENGYLKPKPQASSNRHQGTKVLIIKDVRHNVARQYVAVSHKQQASSKASSYKLQAF